MPEGPGLGDVRTFLRQYKCRQNSWLRNRLCVLSGESRRRVAWQRAGARPVIWGLGDASQRVRMRRLEVSFGLSASCARLGLSEPT